MRTYEKEEDVKAEVKKLLKKYDWFYWMPSANGFGNAGIHDFCAIKNGVFLSVETKFGKRKVTPQQKGFGQSILAESGYAFVVRESTTHILEEFLRRFQESVEAESRREKMSNENGAALLEAIRIMTEELV